MLPSTELPEVKDFSPVPGTPCCKVCHLKKIVSESLNESLNGYQGQSFQFVCLNVLNIYQEATRQVLEFVNI